jgi:hypothetical protein
VAARQRDNDAWNAAAKALTDRHQDAMAAALAKVYGITWPREPYLVDAVGETGPNLGFTHEPPSGFSAHIHASVGSVRNTGNAPLELMFHEASHVATIGGRITKMIAEESARQTGYMPYVYRYNQLPPSVLSAFERHWAPYLDGKITLEQALRDLVRDAR